MRWSEPAAGSEDLLGRAPRPADHAAIRHWVCGQSIVVTGGGGSIGAELCRQCAEHGARRVTVVDIDEGALLRIDAELRGHSPGVECIPVLGDCGDPAVMAHALRLAAADAVFHAAAYKQVPLLEGQLREAVRNNVLATEVVLHASQAARVETFVLISTDKAVDPVNVLGASKRLAEMLCQVQEPASATRMLLVRFGNVLDSAGSVVPLFREQIRRGGPVTVTHPEVTRYFMTIPEASLLILQAATLGAPQALYTLDMGQPVPIRLLAERMVRSAGKQPGIDVAIEYIGLRPGERLHETLFHADERYRPTRYPDILQATPRMVPPARVAQAMRSLRAGVQAYDVELLARVLREAVPEFHPLHAAAPTTLQAALP